MLLAITLTAPSQSRMSRLQRRMTIVEPTQATGSSARTARLNEEDRARLRFAAGRTIDPQRSLFGPQSLTWRVSRETTLLLGGGRALLLQIAHPLVAAGVVEHSGFAQA